MDSLPHVATQPLFGYQFNNPTVDEPFQHPDASVPPAGPSVLSREDSQRVGTFFTNTTFWPDAEAVQQSPNDDVYFGYYSLPEVHDVSMQSPFPHNDLHSPTFLHHTQPDPIAAMGPPLSSISAAPPTDTFTTHMALQFSSGSSHIHLGSTAPAEQPNAPSLAQDESGSEHSPNSNAITPSPTFSTGPSPFAHRASVPTQMPSRHTAYEVSASPGARLHSFPNDGNRPKIEFGTDDRFRPQGFTGPETLELTRNYTKKISNTISYLQTPVSADSSHPASPRSRKPAKLPQPSSQDPVDSFLLTSADSENLDRPVKRRKMDSFSSSSSQPVQDILDEKPRNSRSTGAGAAGSPPRRKKSSNAASRTNLTDEQKRNNHIKSEQKRRDTIKQGFQDLHSLVPALSTSSYSKADQLKETVEWLRRLVVGNEQLKSQLKNRGVTPYK